MGTSIEHLPDPDALSDRGHRALVVVAGDQIAGRADALTTTQRYARRRWIGRNAPEGFSTVSLGGTRQWLGSECDALVFDAHDGFDPNAFGAASGTVRAGGLLVLLCPALSEWHNHPDPVNDRVTVYGHSLTQSRYLGRLARLLPTLPCSITRSGSLVTTGGYEPSSLPWRLPSGPTTAQTHCIDVLVDAIRNRDPLAAVLQADRGRGKSATLGWLAARLCELGLSVAVTAPSRRAADTLYRHAQAAWPIDWDDNSLPFVAPDNQGKAAHDVLLVDEAGGLHLALTQALIQTWDRLVFAGTVHGYEGSGRGFATRFEHLTANQPHRQIRAQLSEPIRWAHGDPLEACTHNMLLLDAALFRASDKRHCKWIDRDSLAQNESHLLALYTLLSAAHYRTRPLDLRQILDGPNLRVAIVGDGDNPVAAALIAEEGDFSDTSLVDAIIDGKRRPPGHLLPQLMAYQYGDEAACSQRWWRIIRIAVQPECQRSGIGRAMLAWLVAQAEEFGVDVLGASFGADTGVCAFWQGCGFQPAYVGHNREATSGLFSVAMLRALSPLATQSQRLRSTQFQHRLSQRNDIEPALHEQLTTSRVSP